MATPRRHLVSVELRQAGEPAHVVDVLVAHRQWVAPLFHGRHPFSELKI